jgi:hypothetical protein
MYAIDGLRQERRRGVVPYCFILDESYRVIMAGPSSANNPFASLYGSDSRSETLPKAIDSVVRALTSTWHVATAISSRSATIQNLKITVAPLKDKRRIAVFAHRLPPRWRN